MKLFFHWLVGAIAVGVAAYLVPGVHVTLVGALVTAIVLGAFNLILKPILHILTLPITILTLGLFSLVINAALVLLASHIVQGFSVVDFKAALLFSIALSIINWVLHVMSAE